MSFFENEESESNESHFIWAEKYRPQNLEDYLGNESFKEIAQSWISKKEIPHILLHSRKPGTGKTTLAKMLANSIPCDVLYINASKENKIDDIRYKVNSFAGSLGFQELKICILDECDNITLDGQKALRNVMETYAKHCRFILTCNYVNKLLEPLISRCQVFHVQPPEIKLVAKHVAKILDKEGVKYNPSDFKTLMKYYPDIRRIIQTAQQNSSSGELLISENEVLESDSKIKLVDILKSNKSAKDKLVECRQLLMDSGSNDYQDYFDYLYEKVDEIAPNSKANVILAIADYQFKESFVANKEINFAACLIEILKNL